MSEQKESQVKMIELPKPGNADETVLVNPSQKDLPGWQRRTLDLMKEKNLSAKAALSEVKKQDVQEKKSDRWFD